MEWQNVLQILTCKSLSSPFLKKKVKREDELMSHLWGDENIKKLVCIWLRDHHDKKDTKSIAKAETFKVKGNKAFQARNYGTSIDCYMKCALYAPAGSNELAVAIANRSAALFYLYRYNDCIKDIELAIELNYPKQLHYKLYLRALQCYLKLGEQQLAEQTMSKINEMIQDPDCITPTMRDSIIEKMNELKLIAPCIENVVEKPNNLLDVKSQIAFEENTNFPHASASIDRKHNEELGRHVVANRFIKKGDILFLEKPVSFVLLHQNTLHNFCQYCNCSTMDIPVPCGTCFDTFYCSQACLTEALFSYHRFECPGSQMKLWREIGIGHLALKVLLICSTITDKIKFNEMQNLVTNFDKLSMEDLTAYGITAIMLTTYLSEYTNFFKTNSLEDCLMNKFWDKSFNSNFSTSTENDKKLYISSLLLRYILQLIGNGHAITRSDTLLSKNDSDQQDIVATGIYPSASMMNHSCDPNIISIFVGQYLIVRASKDIAENQQIFNCYGPHYRYMTTESRQQVLQSQYCFSCKCEPCTEPKLQYFLEQFNAIKCLKCNGALCHIRNSMLCIDCGDKPKNHSSNKIVQANKIFEAAQVSLELGEVEEALEKLQKCLNIRRTVLYTYNEDIIAAINLMAEIYKKMGRFVDSIKCFESTTAAITERFGVCSIELLNQVNDLIDVCFIYLEKVSDTTTDTYKNILRRTEQYLDQVDESTSFNYGSWNKLYKDVKLKQTKIVALRQRC